MILFLSARNQVPPLILIGTGAGCGPIIDYYMHMTATDYEPPNPVTVYFSTNSVGLFQFFTDLTCSKNISNFKVNAHLTQSDEYEVAGGGAALEEMGDAGDRSSVGMKLGRLSFEEVRRGRNFFGFLKDYSKKGSERSSRQL